MDIVFKALSEQLMTAGLPVLLLVLAVWWLTKKSEAAATNADMRQKEFIESLNKERSERILALEASHEKCEADRFDLRERLLAVLTDDHRQAMTIIKDSPPG